MPPVGDAPADAALLVDAPVLPACANPVAGTKLRMRRIGSLGGGIGTLATAPRGDRRLFAAERDGRIWIFGDDRVRLPDPFLDISAQVLSVGSSELGLLGLAFHPEYAANGLFYIYYTRTAVPADANNKLRDVVARCHRSAADPNQAEGCEDLLVIPDFAVNHNGGMMEFGRDGYLYIGTGDGGGGGDPRGNAQTLVDGTPDPLSNALLGKLLRIDVDHPAAGKLYGTPADNPFPTAPEVYARGLRNPWRWAFDAETGDMWIGDVGQNNVEEVDFVAADAIAGANFGWDMWEANSCFTPPCAMTGMTFPQIQRTHVAPPAGDGWQAVIGGSVYRGTCYPDLVGTYLFTNFEFRTLTLVTVAANGSVSTTEVSAQPGDTLFPQSITSIHADAFGELYATITNGVYAIEVVP